MSRFSGVSALLSGLQEGMVALLAPHQEDLGVVIVVLLFIAIALKGRPSLARDNYMYLRR